MRGVTFLRPGWLVLLLLVPGAWLAWRRWPPPLPRRHARLAIGFRIVIVVLLVLVLAGLHATRQPSSRAVVAVVDVSDSVQGSIDQAADAVRALIRGKGRDDLFGVVTFGRDAQVELSPTRHPGFDGFQTRPDPSYSDLAGALELAANLIPDGYGRQLVLMSDGRQNLGDASTAVARLHARGVRVDVLPLGQEPGGEAMVAELQTPSYLREGQVLAATAQIRSTATANGTLALQVDGREVAKDPIIVPTGLSAHPFTVGALEPGLHRLRVVLDVDPDSRSENNLAEAVVRVLGPPSVLVLEGSPGGSSNVTAALEAAGMRVDTRSSEETPTDAAALAAYDSVVVVDAPADAFPQRALPAIAANVADLGRGLVTIGGSASYGPGAWQGTSLEKALPVRMDLPLRTQKPSIAAVVVMETMEYPEGDRVAVGALQSVLDQLGPEDEFGAVTMRQIASSFSVPLGPVTDKNRIMNAVRLSELGDPLGYGPPLEMALEALRQSTAATKHVIVIGDGDAVADISRYASILAGHSDVTVSVVGVDTEGSVPFMQHMRQLAKLGGGRYYQSDNATDVPEILLKVANSALRPWFEQDGLFPDVTSAGDLLEGVPLDAFPRLGGYVVTTAKGGADVALTSPKGDPVLAGWHYGLGRSVAWTSDARGRWTSQFLASPLSGTLFARMVAWTLPGPPSEGLQVQAVPSGDGLDVTVTGPGRGGEVEVTALGPDQTRTVVPLQGTDPGRWQGRVPAPALGTYVLRAQLRRAGVVAGTETLVSVAYSPEYLALGRDDDLLGRLGRQGGALLASVRGVWSERIPPVAVARDVFTLLLLAAAVLWPLEVAMRRLNLGPRGLLRAIVSFRPLPGAEVVVPPTLTRLRERRRTQREAMRVPSGPPPPTRPVPTAEEASRNARLLEARRRRQESDGERRQ